MTPARLGKIAFLTLAAIAFLAATVITVSIMYGGPAPIVALDSINSPFKGLDHSAMPAVQRYTARDGAALGYRHYPAAVDALDVCGHGDSGKRGQIGYIGQLEDDLTDFMRAVPHPGPSTLIGFSAGAGFAPRFAASPQAALLHLLTGDTKP